MTGAAFWRPFVILSVRVCTPVRAPPTLSIWPGQRHPKLEKEDVTGITFLSIIARVEAAARASLTVIINRKFCDPYHSQGAGAVLDCDMYSKDWGGHVNHVHELDQPGRYRRACHRAPSPPQLEQVDATRRLPHTLRQGRSQSRSRELALPGLITGSQPQQNQKWRPAMMTARDMMFALAAMTAATLLMAIVAKAFI